MYYCKSIFYLLYKTTSFITIASFRLPFGGGRVKEEMCQNVGSASQNTLEEKASFSQINTAFQMMLSINTTVDCSVNHRFWHMSFLTPPTHNWLLLQLREHCKAKRTHFAVIYHRATNSLLLASWVYNTSHFQTTPEIWFPKYSKLFVLTL